MSHIYWVGRQNKLEIPNDEEEVNTWEIHKCDCQVHDPNTMVVPLTPKSIFILLWIKKVRVKDKIYTEVVYY